MSTDVHLRPVQKLFIEALDLLNTKSHDYAHPSDPHSNFKYAQAVMEPFPEEYKPYASHIGTKLSRLAELLSRGSPKHESIEDTFLDLLNYCALMAERYSIAYDTEESRP